MIKFENVDVYGWESAIRNMRNPENSLDKSDSFKFPPDEDGNLWIGPNDIKLMRNHSECLRMINVTCDITAPLYWWGNSDTVVNSCSAMHFNKEFTLDDFSHEHLFTFVDCNGEQFGVEIGKPNVWCGYLKDTIFALNVARELYLQTKDKNFWWQMIQLLPSSYNQMRTVQLNYQVLLSMYKARKDHKLDEWREFCEWIETLPYFKEICLGGGR